MKKYIPAICRVILVLGVTVRALSADAADVPAQDSLARSAAAAVIPEVEESAVATLPPMSDHWVVLVDIFYGKNARIFDGDSGKLLGTLQTPKLANVAVDPLKRYFYVAETIWTKGNRGTRQDLLTVYDARTLALVAEIPLPGRLLTGSRRQGLDISADGRYAYIYDLSPTSSIIIVDLENRTVSQTVETPGCSLAFAGSNGSIGTICGDGSIAAIGFDAKRKIRFTQSKPFFAPDDDPVFDNSIVDRGSGKALLLSYSGLVYETIVDGMPNKVAPPWSIQKAGGMAAGSTDPLAVSWLPGGRQLMAYHASTGRLYVLMHKGEFWSHKQDGEEVWVLDTIHRKLVARHHLSEPASYIEVSQDKSPILFLSLNGKLRVLDAETFTERQNIDSIATGLLAVLGR